MRVLHVIPSLSPTQGGPSFALPLMARSLVQAGVAVDVATTDDDGPGGRLSVPLGQRIERDGYGVWHFAKQTEFYKVSLPFRSWIRHHLANYDLVHIHALFSFSSNSAARAARRVGVPYVIRPLGVLNHWGMENRRRVLKRLSFRFIEQPLLRHAAAIQFTADAERFQAGQSGVTAPAAVVPLGIDVNQFASLPGPEKFFKRVPQASNRNIVLFLSRLDSKKGLDLLLPAFAKLRKRFPDALLVIAGNGEESFVNCLRSTAAKLGLAGDVVWAGFLTGADKLAAFSAAKIFTLPSYSENFGIALVEALAAGLPSVTTDAVAVSEDITRHNAGLVVPCNVAALAEALERALGNTELRLTHAANARRLAKGRFSLEAMGMALKELYQRTLTEKQIA